LYEENAENVPLFKRCDYQAAQLVSLRENHPVWSSVEVFKSEQFKELTALMRPVWMNRHELKATAVAAVENVDNARLLVEMSEVRKELVTVKQ
jgi:hypothetical protein